MKKLLLPILIASAPLTWAASFNADPVSAKPKGGIVLDATEDFSVLDAGDAPYYVDTRNDALGIDARLLEYRNLFAQAQHTYQGKSGEFDVTITPLTEEDGEPIYRLKVNGKIVGTYQSSYIGKGSEKDLTPEYHTWKAIQLNKGDVVSVESAADTNGEIPEHGGTAWARGRWQSLTLGPVAKGGRPHFRFESDLLLAQFDNQPDADDIHAQAALGSMLVHPDFKGLNVFAVSGAVGIQEGKYIDSTNLFSMAFGQENFKWTNARKNWDASVNLVKQRVKAVLAKGGKVWVQEAGQSDFTRDWIEALAQSGVTPAVIKNSVVVVQHSAWNEEKTTPEDLAYVKAMTDYHAIDDGNSAMKEFNRHGRRGALTPIYVNQDKKWLDTATSSKNTKSHSRKLWQEAVRIIEGTGFDHDYSVIPKGGVDFSDTVENWWIFNLGYKAPSVHAFWDRYVTDAQLDVINAPKGRLAVVIDGNSPDPDDVGATPVMLRLLQQTGLRDRLVHLSHSCDLDPFRNKGIQRIDAPNEARRQKVLHELSGKGTELFGPFNNLRDYYNCRVDKEGAINDLKEAINASTAKDPLWIIEAGEPDVIGYALQVSNPDVHKHVHVVSHHPANDNSGDYFTWQQILDFGVTEHQIGDQNVGLQTPMHPWDWAENHPEPGIQFIWKMMAYAEQDGVVPFQANKFDCSDAGMIYWWITGADKGGNNSATESDMKDMLLLKSNL